MVKGLRAGATGRAPRGCGSWTCWSCGLRLQDEREADIRHGLEHLHRADRSVEFWSFSPPGFGDGDGLPSFDLDDIRTARSALFSSIRRALGAYAWVVQAPDIVLPGRPERLGLHVLTAGRTMTTPQLNQRAQAAGFGDADVRPLDRLSNSAHSVAGYVCRHLGRDGYRLAPHHGRVDLAGFSRGWSR